jgi:hypothetical protein
MVDAGEQVSETLKREFTEEALDGVDDKQLDVLWSKGKPIYKGYVDDPRNTDNAWMETVAVNFHDDSGLLSKAKFKVSINVFLLIQHFLGRRRCPKCQICECHAGS